MNEFKAQSLERLKPIVVGSLPSARTLGCSRVDLETPHQIVGQDADLLPEPAGLPVVGRDGVES